MQRRKVFKHGLEGGLGGVPVLQPVSAQAEHVLGVIRRPRHTVTIGRSFRALTTEAELLPSLLEAGDDLPPVERAAILRRTG
jgi:hypothetical protein